MEVDLPPWPPSFEVDHSPHQFVIRWRWRRRRAFYWISGVLTVAFMMLGGYFPDLPPLLPFDSPAMRPAGFMIIAVMLYPALAALVNCTELSIREGVLEVRHRPLPWWPRRIITCEEIKQLFCREHLERDEDGKVRDEYYSVHAELNSGRQLRLVVGLWHLQQATWIEDSIESLLGIEDQAVAGEHFRARGTSKYL